MGILAEPLALIAGLADLPKPFSVCELGDQFVTEGPMAGELAVVFYRSIGCRWYVSIDANGRNGSLALDLNKPMFGKKAERFKQLKPGSFDVVTDFGTGEHVFNQLEVWRSMHSLCKVGGYIVFDRPSEGYLGHCFYLIQFNLITALAHANQYQIKSLTERKTARGRLIRGAMKKVHENPFFIPQQGRYVRDLVAIDQRSKSLGPDHKSQVLRNAGLVGKGRQDDGAGEAAE